MSPNVTQILAAIENGDARWICVKGSDRVTLKYADRPQLGEFAGTLAPSTDRSNEATLRIKDPELLLGIDDDDRSRSKRHRMIDVMKCVLR